MKVNRSTGSLVLAAAVLVATLAPLDASAKPPSDSARSTRPSSSGSSSSGQSVSRSGSSQSSQSVSRAPSSSSRGHGAGATRPPAGTSGGVVQRGERRGGGTVIVHPRWHNSYWHFGLGLGYPWGYYWGPYGWYGYGGYGGYGWPGPPGGGYGPGYPRDLRYEAPGAVDLNVKPKRVEVYVNGELVGNAGSFDGFPDYLWLTPGSHELIFYRDGYVTQRRVVNVRPSWVLDLRLALQSGETLPPEQVSRPPEDAGQGDETWRQRQN